MFSKIGSVILLVDDMERTTLFYKDTLGLKLKVKTTDWIEFFEKGTTLALHPRRRKGLPEKNERHSNNILVGFMVSDLDQVVKEPKTEPFGKHAIILDPDDHLISIAEIQSTKSSEEFDLIGFLGSE